MTNKFTTLFFQFMATGVAGVLGRPVNVGAIKPKARQPHQDSATTLPPRTVDVLVKDQPPRRSCAQVAAKTVMVGRIS